MTLVLSFRRSAPHLANVSLRTLGTADLSRHAILLLPLNGHLLAVTMSQELAQSGLTMQLMLCWSLSTTSCERLLKLLSPFKCLKSPTAAMLLWLVRRVQGQIVQCNVKQTVKEEAGSCRIIRSGQCRHEHISTTSQVDKTHDTHTAANGASHTTVKWNVTTQLWYTFGI